MQGMTVVAYKNMEMKINDQNVYTVVDDLFVSLPVRIANHVLHRLQTHIQP